MYLRIASDCIFGSAVAKTDAVGPEGVGRTRQIARRTEKSRLTLAVAEESIAVSAVTLLRTRITAIQSVKPARTPVGARLPLHARRTQAITGYLRREEVLMNVRIDEKWNK